MILETVVIPILVVLILCAFLVLLKALSPKSGKPKWFLFVGAGGAILLFIGPLYILSFHSRVQVPPYVNPGDGRFLKSEIENLLPGIRYPFIEVFEALKVYDRDHGRFPDSLETLLENGILESIPQPEWGANHWDYRKPAWADRGGGGFQLIAKQKPDPSYEGLYIIYTHESGLSWG